MFVNCEIFKNFFKGLCFLTTLAMIVNWIIIFQKDEDISSIEISAPGLSDKTQQPELNICIAHPFLEEKFRQLGDNITSENYLNYLQGQYNLEEGFAKLEFDDITLNLLDYLLFIGIAFKPGSAKFRENCNSYQRCPYVKFRSSMNGFAVKGEFWKCYGLKPHEDYVKSTNGIYMVFNSSLRKAIENTTIYTVLSYPKQMFRINTEGEYIWSNLNDTSKFAKISIKQVELITRRDKFPDACMADWKEYDDYVLHQKIKKLGCRAPYETNDNIFPICDTKDNLKESMFIWYEIGSKYPPPCHEISSIVSYAYETPTFLEGYDPSVLGLHINYPGQIKVITQSKKVDGQSLLGYIGGYVGLFLGKLECYNLSCFSLNFIRKLINEFNIVIFFLF